MLTALWPDYEEAEADDLLRVPISAGILGLAVVLLALSLYSTWRAKRRAALQSSAPA